MRIIEEQEITQKEILDSEFPVLSKPISTNDKNIIAIPEILNDKNKLSLVFKKLLELKIKRS